MWVVALLLTLTFTSCHHNDPDEFSHSLLIYMAADNNLSSNAQDNIDELLANSEIPSNQALLLFVDRLNVGANLIRVQTVNGVLQCDTLKNYGTIDSALPTVLGEVIFDAREACPANTYGLILWSHGTGWLPKGAYGETGGDLNLDSYESDYLPGFRYNIYNPKYPTVKTFGVDGPSQIEIDKLAQVLELTPHEYICFDACLMGNIETCYALRKTCSYIVSSAAEVISKGFPYNQLTSVMFPYTGGSNLTALCDAFYNRFNELSGFNRTATISLVKTDALEDVCQAFKTLVANGLAPSMVDRNLVQIYDRLSSPVFFDFDHLAWTIGSTADYDNFTKKLSQAVIYKKATQTLFMDIKLDHFSGLAAYLPNTNLPMTQAGFVISQWNKAIDWVSK